MTHAPRPDGLRRRRFLLAGALAVTAAAAVPVLTGCTPEDAKPEPPDPLAALATRARADAALATAIVRAHADAAELAAQAKSVATNRTQHAEAIEREVHRARPVESSSASAQPSASPGPSAPAQAKAAATKLAEAMRTAEQEASALVPGLPRYRAGMIGSVAASCAALREVLT